MAAAQLPAGFLADWAVRPARAGAGVAPQHALAPTGALPRSAGEGCPQDGQTTALTAEDGSAATPESDTARCAVSLSFLSDFNARCVAPLERDGVVLSTSDVVDRLIKPALQAQAAGPRTFASLVPGAVGPPTCFAEVGWRNPFSLLVSSLEERFVDAVPEEVYIWFDIFAFDMLRIGEDVADVVERAIELAGETAVVLDRAAEPLKRLWCLYEMSITPLDQLRMLTHGFRVSDLVSVFRSVNLDAAACVVVSDAAHIRERIIRQHGSLRQLRELAVSTAAAQPHVLQGAPRRAV